MRIHGEIDPQMLEKNDASSINFTDPMVRCISKVTLPETNIDADQRRVACSSLS